VLLAVAASASAAEPQSSMTLAEQCSKEILTPPHVLHADMRLPGKEHQDVFIVIEYGPVSETCNGHFKRLSSVMPQLVRHGHTINMDPVWDELLRDGNTNEASPPGEGPGIEWFNSGHKPKLYYRHGDKVRFQLRLQVLSLASKRITRTVVTTHPVTVEH
jgi:hypothetical protein